MSEAKKVILNIENASGERERVYPVTHANYVEGLSEKIGNVGGSVSSLSELSDDSEHRLVSDAEKESWNNKLTIDGDGSDLSVSYSEGTQSLKDVAETVNMLVENIATVPEFMRTIDDKKLNKNGICNDLFFKFGTKPDNGMLLGEFLKSVFDNMEGIIKEAVDERISIHLDSKADKTIATQSDDGLMSKEDKKKLDGLGGGGITLAEAKSSEFVVTRVGTLVILRNTGRGSSYEIPVGFRPYNDISISVVTGTDQYGSASIHDLRISSSGRVNSTRKSFTAVFSIDEDSRSQG